LKIAYFAINSKSVLVIHLGLIDFDFLRYLLIHIIVDNRVEFARFLVESIIHVKCPVNFQALQPENT